MTKQISHRVPKLGNLHPAPKGTFTHAQRRDNEAVCPRDKFGGITPLPLAVDRFYGRKLKTNS